MEARATGDAGEFRVVAGAFLCAEPVLNAVLLEDLWAEPEGAVYVSVHEGGAVVGAAMCSAWRGIQLGLLEARYVPMVVEVLKDVEARRVEGASAGLWPGGEPVDGIRLYWLRDLRPVVADGIGRKAVASDATLVARWVGAMSGVARLDGWVGKQLGGGRLWVWEDGGLPVSVLAHRPAVAGVVRVGPVYTPPEHRRRGYGGALTAHVSQVLRDSGAEVVLRTELENSTAQGIYERIGFEKVADYPRYALRKS